MTGPALGRPLDAYGTSRVSRLRPATHLLAHADLHNHTWLSDGAGDPELAFSSMRRAGLDVAALTDHAVFAAGVDDVWDLPWVTRLSGIDREAWARLGRLADAADDPGRFVAIRGFEWSHPLLGHVNVWGTETFVDPFRTFDTDLSRFYDWLARTGDGAAGRGLASFNHPGGRGNLLVFAGFELHPAVVGQMAGLEVFNKRLDYLYEGVEGGDPSPLVRCLDQGWRPGLIGVSDEHGTDWGLPDGKGRTGLYVTGLSRAAVRTALADRQVFATRLRGLRLDATLDGHPMGGAVRLPGPARVRVEVDVDRGEPWRGRPLSLQLLTSGERMPAVVAAGEFAVPGPDDPLPAVEVEVDPARTPWLVLRVSDPAEPADSRATGPWVPWGSAVAYASPWWLEAG
ncbi:CehA/McbA family metallohydrolase [Geodermatophilus sp. DSM 44513]|uniref:CehA/McbA family metallohydrolase n=1 Tax=Geodermatophilus sp. DSM 44513 TaxID=1528104 RepID=UPI00126E8A86|nr:CehA/McbA family metallohydrolase [Geodermatophilus sp. DSM 44513]WNV76803.1 CehA/McbA family metallohydrolase [Geodermatophilus sp. DSM 44513]